MIPGRHQLIRPYPIAKLLEFTVVGILSQKAVQVVQGTLVIPHGNHLLGLDPIAKLLQLTVVGILG